MKVGPSAPHPETTELIQMPHLPPEFRGRLFPDEILSRAESEAKARPASKHSHPPEELINIYFPSVYFILSGKEEGA